MPKVSKSSFADSCTQFPNLGNDLEYELKNLRPMEHIQVRLRAVQLDSEGKRQEGDWTPVSFACSLCDVTSPPLNLAIREPGASSVEDSPAAKPSTSHASKPLKVSLTWNVPAQLNGSSVQEYIVSALRCLLFWKFISREKIGGLE